jgi:hypothetical protein
MTVSSGSLARRARHPPATASACGTHGAPITHDLGHHQTKCFLGWFHGSTTVGATGAGEATPAGESFLRVDWVAVPKELRARRVNRLLQGDPSGLAGPNPGESGGGKLTRWVGG